MFADCRTESRAATAREQQVALGNIRQLPVARPHHYHLSHEVMPVYFADPAHLGALRQIITELDCAQELVAQFYQQTLLVFPACDPCFTPAAIVCSRQSITSLGLGAAADIPLLVFTMPRAKAAQESFLTASASCRQASSITTGSGVILSWTVLVTPAGSRTLFQGSMSAMTTTLLCTFNLVLPDAEVARDFIDRLFRALGHRPDNLIVEPYWKIADQFQARLSLDLGVAQVMDEPVAEARAIAAVIARGNWQALGPDRQDEVVYELFYDGMAEEGPLKWGHLQLCQEKDGS